MCLFFRNRQLLLQDDRFKFSQHLKYSNQRQFRKLIITTGRLPKTQHTATITNTAMEELNRTAGSSTGFRRTLKRPGSSAGLVPIASYLKTVDISQPESLLNSQLSAQISSLQQDIDQLDIDKKIRQGDAALDKAYILKMRTWLKQTNNKFDREDDDLKVLKQLGTDDYQVGFKKLWRITGHLDSLILKQSQLSVVGFLKYEDLFSGLCSKGYNPQIKKLQAIAQTGLTLGGSNISEVLMERYQDLFSLVSKARKSSSASSKPQSATGSTANQAQDLVAQLQAENTKLNSYLQKMNQELKNQISKNKTQPKVQPPPPQETSKPVAASTVATQKVEKSALDKVCSELSERYSKQIESLNGHISALLDEQARLKSELNIAQEKIDLMKKNMGQSALIQQKFAPGSYEAALQEQLTQMQHGYETKISKLMTDFAQRERELKRKENEYRVEAEKVKFERGLLLRKYDLMK